MGDNYKTNRRDFIGRYFKEAREGLLKSAASFIKASIKRSFLRPPGALPEDEFLFACSRCKKCAEACPYEAIHLIDDITSPHQHGTPFIDPKHQACQFCPDAPCIKSCEDGALAFDADDSLPKMGTVEVAHQHCLVAQGQYCDYCFRSCPEGINAIFPDDKGMPVIDQEACVGCGKCVFICVSQTGEALRAVPE